jgi:TetR/AcrR family transcriptional repressor of bet genes
MPKLGMEPIRRAALIDAAIAEIGRAGSLDVTVSQIAKRAGMSSGLAHHYFGGKDDIVLAAMRHVLKVYAAEVQSRLVLAETPPERLSAIIEGNFAPSNFRADTIAAWLTFYALALSSDEARRLHRVYAGRLRSNLRHALRPMVGDRAAALADRTAQMIDGVYLNHGLGACNPDWEQAVAAVMASLDDALDRPQQ